MPPRLTRDDVACWVLKSALPPAAVAPGWRPGAVVRLQRCVRRSYRLDLVRPGQPCLLWVSGRDRPGVHALGEVVGPAGTREDGQPVLDVALRLLAAPVPRAQLLPHGGFRDAEVLRMPAGSNPSYLTPGQFAALAGLLPAGGGTPTR
ncbi:hypothetical protein [Kineococcus glutinatus]|uniref:hypothetical protein n=1 Tax=Kineococcus glutinatus TaxID=1070872 RepID=UPI0031EFA9ED